MQNQQTLWSVFTKIYSIYYTYIYILVGSKKKKKNNQLVAYSAYIHYKYVGHVSQTMAYICSY